MTGGYKGLQGVFLRVQGVAGSKKGLQWATRGFKG